MVTVTQEIKSFKKASIEQKLKLMLEEIERMHDTDIVILNAINKQHEDNIRLRRHIRELIERESKLTKRGFIEE